MKKTILRKFVKKIVDEGVPRRFARVGVKLRFLLLGGIQPPFPPIRRDTGRLLSNPLLGIFVSSEPHKGSATFAPPNIRGVSEGRGGFAPPNIGGVSEGRGGFAAPRIPHA